MLNETSFIDPGQSPQIRFNIMVCGESGSGKVSFLLMLFEPILYPEINHIMGKRQRFV